MRGCTRLSWLVRHQQLRIIKYFVAVATVRLACASSRDPRSVFPPCRFHVSTAKLHRARENSRPVYSGTTKGAPDVYYEGRCHYLSFGVIAGPTSLFLSFTWREKAVSSFLLDFFCQSLRFSAFHSLFPTLAYNVYFSPLYRKFVIKLRTGNSQ